MSSVELLPYNDSSGLKASMFSRASVKSPRRLEATRSEQAYREPAKATEDVPGFELIKIPGTGSCLFQSIAQCNYYLSEGEQSLITQVMLRNPPCFCVQHKDLHLQYLEVLFLQESY